MWSDGRDIFEGGGGGAGKQSTEKFLQWATICANKGRENIFKRERNTIACLYRLSRKTVKLLSDLGERKLVPEHPFLSFALYTM